ncbi:MAG: hypothetical protein ACYCU7_18135 [Acidimicrobiales bacterium]
MAVLPEGTPAVEEHGAPDTETARRRLDRLNPLIHELLAWDLVYQDESGEFGLRPDVQRRLLEAAARAPRFAADVYVGRHCERCGVVGITRLSEGMRLCDACRAAPEADDPSPVGDVRPRRRGGLVRRYREAG